MGERRFKQLCVTYEYAIEQRPELMYILGHHVPVSATYDMSTGRLTYLLYDQTWPVLLEGVCPETYQVPHFIQQERLE